MNTFIKLFITTLIIILIFVILSKINTNDLGNINNMNNINDNNKEIETFKMFNGSNMPENIKNYQFKNKKTFIAFPKKQEKPYLGWRTFLQQNNILNATQNV